MTTDGEFCRLGTSVAYRVFGDTKRKSLVVKSLELSPEWRATNGTRIVADLAD